MSESKDGGAAFPSNEKNDDGSHYYSNEGMSLRDYFAAQALVSRLAHYAPYDSDFKRVASDAYALADALLAAREVEHG